MLTITSIVCTRPICNAAAADYVRFNIISCEHKQSIPNENNLNCKHINIEQTLTMTHSAPSFTQGKYLRKWAQRQPRSKSGHCEHVRLLQNRILNSMIFNDKKKLF